MVVAETIAGLGAIKTAFDMAKGLESIHETVARDRAVIELQKEILAAQSTQAALVETVSALKARVTELETWDAEKRRYQRHEIAAGVLCLHSSQRNAAVNHSTCFVQNATMMASHRSSKLRQ